MCDPVSATIAAVTAATTLYQGQEQRKALDQQARATQDATAAAAKTASLQEQEINRANAKTADVNGLLSANEQSAKGGLSGTMLTGPTGIDPKQLLLGKTTLLGG